MIATQSDSLKCSAHGDTWTRVVFLLPVALPRGRSSPKAINNFIAFKET